MVKAKKWILATQFQGPPKESNFKLVEEDLPALKPGECLFEALFLSVDPYMRAFPMETGSTIIGEQVAKVIESKNKDYPVDCLVQMHCGWRTRTVGNPKDFPAGFRFEKVPNLGTKSPSIALGVAGMPGVTAYYGFLDVCQPKTGDVVVVNGAAGAVGSLVGQIAKIKNCSKVIGFAGSKEKCDWVKSLGFDEVFNYKEIDIDTALKKAAPEGVDIFYDNVGGEFASKVIQHMKQFGRVAVGGAISTYNASEQPKLPFPFVTILLKQLKVEGLMVYNWFNKYGPAKQQMLKWIDEGKIKYTETISKGFDNMPKAFIGLLTGRNTGKMVVKA